MDEKGDRVRDIQIEANFYKLLNPKKLIHKKWLKQQRKKNPND